MNRKILYMSILFGHTNRTTNRNLTNMFWQKFLPSSVQKLPVTNVKFFLLRIIFLQACKRFLKPTFLRLDCFNLFRLILFPIDHLTVDSPVTWPSNGSEAGGDLALIQTTLLLSCKCTKLALEKLDLHNKSQRGLYLK